MDLLRTRGLVAHEMPPLDRFIFKLPFVRRLDRLMDNAGMKIDVKVFILFMNFLAVLCFGLGIAMGRGIGPGVVLLVVGFVLPLIYLRIEKGRRITRFTEQFPGALDVVARSLRAGHSFSSAIQTVGSELSEPVAGLFRIAYEEQTWGLSMKDALNRMLERMKSMDLQLFVTAANIHREVGGNLAETLERLAQTIRERIKIRRQVRVYTAQGRLSGYILAALPVIVALFLYFTSPDYLEELVSVKEGKYGIGIVVGMQIIGFLVIRKLINIRI